MNRSLLLVEPYANNSLTQLCQSNIPNYWNYAQNFVLGDNMFSSLMGPSFPNHLYTIAAQSWLSSIRIPIMTIDLYSCSLFYPVNRNVP